MKKLIRRGVLTTLIFMIAIFLLLVKNIDSNPNDRIIIQTGTFNLMWQDNEDAKNIEKDFIGANEYCKTLTLGGFTDWRLPAADELLMISDRSKYNIMKIQNKYKSITIANRAFKNVSKSHYWSSTFDLGINLFDGSEDIIQSKYANANVRCVRLNKVNLNFRRNNTTLTVTNENTNLIFQDNEDAKRVRKDWKEANDYCKDLKINNLVDWRLPSINELTLMIDRNTLFDTNESIRNITLNKIFQISRVNHSFKNIEEGVYWSSTYRHSPFITDNTEIDYAWSASFSMPFIASGSITGKEHYVRCVTNGQLILNFELFKKSIFNRIVDGYKNFVLN